MSALVSVQPYYNPPLWPHQWRPASEQVSVFSRFKQLVRKVFLQFLTIFGVRVFAIIRLYGPSISAGIWI